MTYWNNLPQALTDAKASGEPLWISQVAPLDSSQEVNEFCVFLKPEVLEPDVDVEGAWTILQDAIEAASIDVIALGLLPGAYLRGSGAMAQHYGQIDRVSREGANALAGPVLAEIDSRWGSARVLGSLQVTHDDLGDRDLGAAFDAAEVTKLAPGTYGALLEGPSGKFVALNGFYPAMIAHFERDSAAIAVVHARTSRDWKWLRSDWTGATNPETAIKGSLRRTFLAESTRLGIAGVGSGRNCVHVSAGPLEGAVELRRFFAGSGTAAGDPVSNLNLAQLASLDEERLDYLATNPVVSSGDSTELIFDLTEEMDTKQALPVIEQA